MLGKGAKAPSLSIWLFLQTTKNSRPPCLVGMEVIQYAEFTEAAVGEGSGAGNSLGATDGEGI